MGKRFWILVLVTAVAGAAAGGALLNWLGNPADPGVPAARTGTPDPETRARRQAYEEVAVETREFIDRHLADVPVFENRHRLLEHSIASVDESLDGHFCEFGVYKGESINRIASLTSRTVHGFDSFEGLPETWRPGYEKGTFAIDGLPEVRPNVELHKGWFEDSLPVWAREHPGPIAFAHMDADLYSSTKTVFDVLADRFVPGTVVQLDEYYNYPGWREGEYKAFQEFVAEQGFDYEYLGYVADGEQQVAVRLLSGAGVKSVGSRGPGPR